MTIIATPFDTLAFVKKVEETRVKELATKEDILRLEKELQRAKVETIQWVIASAIVILGGVATINRFFPPVPIYYQPFTQEMRLPAHPAPPPHGQGVPAPSR
ncbi:MAG: hypothetical protein HQM03_00185 [Magnetococcales bacterium]|nr:hypothetical protein [Magnetococcales bacterium]